MCIPRGPSPDRLATARAVLARVADEPAPRASGLSNDGTPAEPWSKALVSGLHEWFTSDAMISGSPEIWFPPLAILIDLAHRAIIGDSSAETAHHRTVLWIGKSCWPYPPALRAAADDHRVLDASVFVETASRAERVWAIEQAARCPGVGLGIGDGRGLTMAESRRLQLASAPHPQSDPGAGTPILLARPSRERGVISAARTRWHAEPLPIQTPPHHGQWAVELIHRKGAASHTQTCTNADTADRNARRWIVRRDHAAGHLTTWCPDHRGEHLRPTRVDGPPHDGALAPRLVHRPPPPTRSA